MCEGGRREGEERRVNLRDEVATWRPPFALTLSHRSFCLLHDAGFYLSCFPLPFFPSLSFFFLLRHVSSFYISFLSFFFIFFFPYIFVFPYIFFLYSFFIVFFFNLFFTSKKQLKGKNKKGTKKRKKERYLLLLQKGLTEVAFSIIHSFTFFFLAFPVTFLPFFFFHILLFFYRCNLVSVFPFSLVLTYK